MHSDLRAAVVQDLDVGAQSLVHDVDGDVIAVSQVPQQVEHFMSHHSRPYRPPLACGSTPEASRAASYQRSSSWPASEHTALSHQHKSPVLHREGSQSMNCSVSHVRVVFTRERAGGCCNKASSDSRLMNMFPTDTLQ